MSFPQLKVIADALNVRETPAVSGTYKGTVYLDDVVDWLESDENDIWRRIKKGSLVGWSARRYLAPIDQPEPTDLIDEIIRIAENSAIMDYDWKNRGPAPMGYIKGMAVVFGRVYVKWLDGDPIALEMAKSDTGNNNKDALAHYAQIFNNAGLSNEAAGASTLRHLFVLLIGLGMRESSGRYCEGLDRSASNTGGSTAEAGMFQTSYNAVTASPLLPKILQQYSANPEGFLEIFKEGVDPTTKDLENFGTGKGKAFQQLSKSCPAFAAEFAAVGLRHIRTHWGPINTKAAEVIPSCNTMLLKVQQAVDSSPDLQDSLL
jgi:Bacterial SH3 domain